MSEKRFWFEKECTEDFFTEKGVFYNNGRPMGANEIIALLNSLSEENEQLKKGKMEALSLLGEEIDKNEQLKKQSKRYEDGLWVRFTRLEKENEMLKKENEQLRLELETHKHPLWSTREAERKVNKLADSLADEVKKNGLLNEEINQLRIENMRLKKN